MTRYILPVLAAGLVGCASQKSAFTHYSVVPNQEWTRTHLTFDAGNSAWRSENFPGQSFTVSPSNWYMQVRGSGRQDAADRWTPELLALSRAVAHMDGMWSSSNPGLKPPETITNGKASFTRYTMAWGDSGVYPVYEVGNWAWCDSLGDWRLDMLGRCYPYRYLVQIRTTRRDKYGRWIPDDGSDVPGHETWHFPGLGGAFHPGIVLLGVGVKLEDYWVE